jgi:PPOX class probable F420-dependent enzyme
MDRHVESRLKREQVIWLVTAGKQGRPQAVPVWFVWDGKSFLIHSVDGAKVNHIRSNPYVELHLNSDEAGDDLVRASGEAAIAKSPPAQENAAYMRKYGRAIKDLGMTPESFAEQYHNTIRIRRVRLH